MALILDMHSMDFDEIEEEEAEDGLDEFLDAPASQAPRAVGTFTAGQRD